MSTGYFIYFYIKRRVFWILIIFGTLIVSHAAFFTGDLLEEDLMFVVGCTLNMYVVAILGYVFMKKVGVINNNKKEDPAKIS